MAASMADLGFNIDSGPLRRATRELNGLSQGAGRAEGSTNRLTSAYQALGSVFAALGAAQFISEMVRVNTETQKLQASLKTLTGSTKAANEAWATLEAFAKNTPFALSQSVEAFSKMKALGLDPTIEALTSFGNTASAMGKDLNQMIEAVADAATGEFERLKEFGIKSKQQGDNVSFVFQGVETTINKSSKNIVEYLKGIGDVQFAGAMSDQMATLGGQISNLGDSVDDFYRSVGGAGGNAAASASIELIAKSFNVLSENAEKLVDVVSIVGIALGGKLVASAGAGSIAMIASAKATTAAAIATVEATAVEIAFLRSVQGSLAAQLASNAGTAAAIPIRAQLATNTAALIVAQNSYTGALAASTFGARAATGAMTALRGATAFLGGPIGIALIAAGSMYYFRDSLFDTNRELTETEKNVRALSERMADLTNAERLHEKSTIERQLRETAVALAAAREETEKLTKAQSESSASSMSGIGSVSLLADMASASSRVAQLVSEEEALKIGLVEVQEALSETARISEESGQRRKQASNDAVLSIIENLEKELFILEKGERAYLIKTLSVKEATAAQSALAASLYDQIEAETIKQAADTAAADKVKRLKDEYDDWTESVIDSIDPMKEAREEVEKIYAAFEAGDLGDVSADQVKDFTDGIMEAAAKGKDGFNEMGEAVNSFGDSMIGTIGIMRDMTTEGSSGYKKLTVAINALNAMQAINAVLNQSSGEPYSAFGRMAAMVGAVASLGYSVGSLGDSADPTEARQESQGTGTVLGDMGAKTESIANATDIIADTNKQLVNINTGMLRSLQALQVGIAGATSMVIRQSGTIPAPSLRGNQSAEDFFGDFSIIGKTIGKSTDFAVDFFDGLDKITSFGLVDGVMGKIVGSILGGKTSVVDDGIRIIGGQLTDLIDNTLVQAYSTIETKGGWFSSDKLSEQFRDLETNQFSLVFENIYDSVLAGANALGVLPGAVDAAMQAFVVETQMISLEGLDGAEQQQAIEAVLGTVFDNLSGSVVPFLTEIQNVGEGLGETLARAATQVQVMEEAVISLGLQSAIASPRVEALAADALTSLLGGVENFASALTSFESNFLSEAAQLENNTRRLAQALGDLPLPATREGFVALVQAQDLYTQSGRENIATLLRLQGTADEYYEALEDSASELLSGAMGRLQRAVARDREDATRAYTAESDSIRELTQSRLDANQMAQAAAQAGVSAIQQEVQGLNSALNSLKGAFDPLQEVLRLDAFKTLRNSLASGDMTGTGDAANVVSQINAAGFASKEDYQRAQGQTLNLLDQVNKAGEGQLTVAEQALRTLEAQAQVIQVSSDAQLAVLNRNYEDEMARLDSILERFQLQMDTLNGIDNSVISVREAIQEMSASLITATAVNGQTGAQQTVSNMEQGGKDIAQLYVDLLDREIGSTGIEFWAKALASGQSVDDIRNNIMSSEEYRSRTPGFAMGGSHAGGLRMVGERGPEIEMTGASRIMSNGDLMKSLGASTEMVNELRKMRDDMRAANRALVKSSEKQRELLQRWEQAGLPQERTYI